MNVFIARGTLDVGRFPQEQLPALARQGVIRRTDTYWHKGMDGWEPISDLLGPAVWEPGNDTAVLDPIGARVEQSNASSSAGSAPDSAEGSSETPPPRGMARALVAIISLAAVIGLAALGYLLIMPDNDSMEPVPAQLSPRSSPPPAQDTLAIREKALADLRQRLERLPEQPSPPLNTYYYDFTTEMNETFDARTPWKAVIRGRENVLMPDSSETLSRTEFVLTADYTDGEWVYKTYSGATLNTQDQTTTELQHDEMRLAPPVVVGILGLKTRDYSRSSNPIQR